jgi:hypothetical protein
VQEEYKRSLLFKSRQLRIVSSINDTLAAKQLLEKLEEIKIELERAEPACTVDADLDILDERDEVCWEIEVLNRKCFPGS